MSKYCTLCSNLSALEKIRIHYEVS